mgnify:CR=1 FL=1
MVLKLGRSKATPFVKVATRTILLFNKMVLFILPAAADLERPIQPKKIQAVLPIVATFTNGVALPDPCKAA